MSVSTPPNLFSGLITGKRVDAFSGNRRRGLGPTTTHTALATSRRPSVGEIIGHAGDRTSSTFVGSPANNIVAAATVLTSEKIKRMRGKMTTTDTEWQAQAWRMYDITPELAYVTRFEAAAMSRAVLHAARLSDDPAAAPEAITDPDDPAFRAMEEFMGGRVHQSQEIARVDTHLAVAGESWFAYWDDDSGRRWAVLSNDEVNRVGDSWTLEIEGEQLKIADSKVGMIRCWHPHGRKRWEADSPVRHLLPVLGELEALTKHVSATVDSRLAGAGLLLVPSEIDFPKEEDTPEGIDDFTWALFKAMSAPMENRDVASALVPLVAKVAGEFVDKIKHIKFDQPLDPAIKTLREEAIRRIALGVDFPPEVLLGLSDANHWTSWQIEESSIKLHLEPKLQTVCHAATIGWLRPYLKASGVRDADRYVAWYDITQIKLRPNRSTDAKTLHDAALITDRAFRAASGFDENDAPTGEELRQQLLRSILTDAPQLAVQILPILFPGITIPNIDMDPNPQQGTEPSNAPASPDDDATPDTRNDEASMDGDTSNVDRSA